MHTPGGRTLACSGRRWPTTGVCFLSQTQLPMCLPIIRNMSTHSWAHSEARGQAARVHIQQRKPLQPQSRVSAQRGQGDPCPQGVGPPWCPRQQAGT